MNAIRYFTISAILVIWTATAQANVAKFNFTGVVLNINGDPFSLGVHRGDHIAGSFSYETSTPNEFSNSLQGRYRQSIPGGFSIFINLHRFTASPYAIDIGNDPMVMVDSFNVSTIGTLGPGGYTPANISVDNAAGVPGEMSMGLRDHTQSVFSSVQLPVDIKLSRFDGGVGSVYQFTGDPANVQQISYEVTSISSVPEPATMALWVVGLLYAIGITPALSRKKC